MEMKRYRYVLSFLLAGLGAAGMNAQGAKYPPLSEYMMARDAEIALAKSAAPESIFRPRDNQGPDGVRFPNRSRWR